MKKIFLFIIIAVFLIGCGYKDAKISGTVYKDQGNDDLYYSVINDVDPAPGVTVRSGNQETTTDGNGQFILKGEVTSGDTPVKLFFSGAPKYRARTEPVIIPDAESGTLEPESEVKVVILTNP